MAFLVSTTGTLATVVINDLAGRTFIHPTTLFDLEIPNTSDEIAASVDLQNAINSGHIVVQDQNGSVITNVTEAATIPLVTQAEAESGLITEKRMWSPLRVKQAANALIPPSEQPVVQARRTTAATISSSSYTPITLDTVDEENDDTIIEHDDTNTERIVCKAPGMYEVGYGFDADGPHDSQLFVRLSKNGSSEIPGTFSCVTEGEPDSDTSTYPTSKSAYITLAAGDYILFEAKKEVGGNFDVEGLTVKVKKLVGRRGLPGPQGIQGPAGQSLAFTQSQFTLASQGQQSIIHAADPGGSLPHRMVEVLKEFKPLGSLISGPANMTPYDPENFSTLDAAINDGNRANYWYNNRSNGPAGKWIGLDAGAPVDATHAKWYDYTTNAYQPTRYRIEGSNDGVSWTTFVDIMNPIHSPQPEGHTIDLGGTQNYRYWRWYCVTGKQASYILISEFELYNSTTPPFWKKPSDADYELEYISPTETIIRNLGPNDQKFLVNIRM